MAEKKEFTVTMKLIVNGVDIPEGYDPSIFDGVIENRIKDGIKDGISKININLKSGGKKEAPELVDLQLKSK